MLLGFTMIELLIVISIAAILAVIAVPSLRDTLNNTRQASAFGLVISDLNQARGEAIKRNGNVLVCPRNTAGTDCVVSANWLAGWVVCVEGNVANTCAPSLATNPDPNPNVSVIRPALDPVLTLTRDTTDPVRFRANSTATPATLTLGGTWAGAASRYVCVVGTGNISKQLVVCP